MGMQDLPKCDQIIHLDPVAASKERAVVGAQKYKGNTFEEGSTDRDPAKEAYEELADAIYYLNVEAKQSGYRNSVKALRDELIRLTLGLQDYILQKDA